jgi:nucleotide-binding universal stress UspA family protein
MNRTSAPRVLVAYDGSPSARAALRAVDRLLTARSVLVVTVWEPALATIAAAAAAPSMAPLMPPVTDIEESLEDRARHVADEGAGLAQDLGLAAESLAVADEAALAETLAHLAEEHDVEAIVVGSRSHGGALRRKLVGSTSESLLHHARRPVLIVHADAP